MKVICSFCGSDQLIDIMEGSGFDDGQKHYSILECTNCRIVFTESTLTETELAEFYQSSYYGQSNKKFISIIEKFTNIVNHRRANSILSIIKNVRTEEEGLRILDIGCGRATLLKSFAEKGNNCFGVERQGFLPPDDLGDIKLYTDNLLDMNFDANYFDIVILWHSLEHLQNPCQILEEAWRILKENGLLVITSPNFDSTQRKLFNRFWFHLDLPRHRFHFSLDALIQRLEVLKFEIVKNSTFSFEQNPYGFIQSALNMLAPSKPPNRLYAILKSQPLNNFSIEMVNWFLLGALLSPFSILEYLVSGMQGKGAVFTIFGIKHHDPR